MSEAGKEPLWSLVEQYQAHISEERRLFPATAKAYLSAVRRWLSFAAGGLERELELADLDLPCLRRFLASRFEEDDPVTVRWKLGAIRNFYRFLTRRRLVAENLANVVMQRKLPQRLPKFLSVQEVKKLIEYEPPLGRGQTDPASKELSEAVRARDRALLELIYGAGLRVSEAVNLDRPDVTQETDGLLTVKVITGIGHRARSVPAGRYAAAALQAYLPQRTRLAYRLRGSLSTEALFVTPCGRRLVASTVRALLNERAAAVRLPKITPYALRHSYAAHMLGSGADLRSLQELLGHASILTTARYCQIDVPALWKSYANHPRAFSAVSGARSMAPRAIWQNREVGAALSSLKWPGPAKRNP